MFLLLPVYNYGMLVSRAE